MIGLGYEKRERERDPVLLEKFQELWRLHPVEPSCIKKLRSHQTRSRSLRYDTSAHFQDNSASKLIRLFDLVLSWADITHVGWGNLKPNLRRRENRESTYGGYFFVILTTEDIILFSIWNVQQRRMSPNCTNKRTLMIVYRFSKSFPK